MGNTIKLSGDNSQNKAQNNKIILKSFLNYQPKTTLIYKGSKSKCFFFCDRQIAYNGLNWINFIHILQQFSLNGQAKILKKWRAYGKNIVFMNKCTDVILLSFNNVQIWKIDTSYNINYKVSFSLNITTAYINTPYKEPTLMQLNAQDDYLVVSYFNEIYFLNRQMDETWNCIKQMDPKCIKFILNDQGNILIILFDDNHNFLRKKIKVYMKSCGEKWMMLKEMNDMSNGRGDFVFLNNQQFAVTGENQKSIKIWEVLTSKLEVRLLKVLKLELNSYAIAIYMNVLKQSQFLIVRCLINDKDECFYLIKQNKKEFDIKQVKGIENGFKMGTEEGLVINFQRTYKHFPGKYQGPETMIFFKIYQN